MKRHLVWILTGLMISGLLGFSLFSLAKEGEWTKKADMLAARYAFSTCVVNGKIYAIGGKGPGGVFATVEEYNPTTDKWTKKADMPTARVALSASTVGGKIYAIGGALLPNFQVVTAAVEEYDAKTGTWTKKADMPTAKITSASVVNGKIYVIGGYDGNNELSTVEEYNPATDTWTKKADMPTARDLLSTSAVNGKIYAIGGMLGNIATAAVEEYDAVADRWTKKADMPTARAELGTDVAGGRIYAIGGWSSSLNNAVIISTVEEYDVATDKWARKADMPTARCGLSASTVGGKIYAIGGLSQARAFLSTVEEYDTGFAESVDAEGKLPATWGKIKAK